MNFIRDALVQVLAAKRLARRDRALIEGYSNLSQAEARDEWGDLDAWSEANARRDLVTLDDKERR